MLTLLRRIAWLLNRRKHEQDLAIELESHRAMMGDRSPAFGSNLRHIEDTRAAWGTLWLDRLHQDLTYAARQLRRAPAFTTAAVAMLALGIGINAGAFSLANFSFFRPLPVRDPDTLVQIQQQLPKYHNPTSHFTPAAHAFYRDHNTVLRTLYATTSRRLSLDADTGKQELVMFTEHTYFTEVAAAPAYGRYFTPADDHPTAEPSVVLAYRYWETNLAADPTIVGRTIRINGRPVPVIGIASKDLIGPPMGGAAWMPLTKLSSVAGNDSIQSLLLYGRFRPGITKAAGEQALTTLAAQLAKQEGLAPQDTARITTHLAAYLAFVEWDDDATVPVLSVITLLLLILVIGCLNLSNLLLARALAREREFNIRFSIGAGRLRLLRQLLTECLLLSLLGGVAGLIVSVVVSRIILALLHVPEIPDLPTDHRVALFTLGISLLATLFFGLLPALRISRQNFQTGHLRMILVGAQVAACILLLAVSGLAIRGVARYLAVDPGFAYKEVVYLDPQLDAHAYNESAARDYLATLTDSLRTLPGVADVAVAIGAPFSNSGRLNGTLLRNPTAIVSLRAASPRFFHAAGITLHAGREFQPDEQGAVIVSRSLATRLWPNDDPLGKRFPPDIPLLTGEHSVVGIAADAEEADKLTVYRPIGAANDPLHAIILIRTAGDPRPLPALARSVARSLDTQLTPSAFRAEDKYRETIQSRLRVITATTALGAIALLLAVSGIYGLLVYTVNQRTREIGIRIALGATARSVTQLLLAQFARPIATGLFIGLAAGWATAKIVRLEGQGFRFLDPYATTGAIAIFLAATALSALLPIRRALKLNPSTALRHD